MKRGREQSGQNPNSRLRVLFVELDGADTTIAEALRTVERMRRPSEILQQPLKRVAGSGTTADGQGPAAEQTTLDLGETAQEHAGNGNGNGNGDAETDVSEASARPKRGQGPKKDRNAGIQLVGDLDLVPNGKPALKGYFAEKAPGSDMDQVLVLCHYFQHVLQLATFGLGHILTGFRHVDEPVPVDLRGTVRHIKNSKAWLSFTDMENIRVTTQGDNRVQHELGKSGSKDE